MFQNQDPSVSYTQVYYIFSLKYRIVFVIHYLIHFDFTVVNKTEIYIFYVRILYLVLY